MSSYIVNLLIEERDRLQEAISALQGAAPTKRRGRPPAKKTADVYNDPTMPDWVKPASKKAPAPKKRKMSAAGRRAIREGVRKRWAAVKAAKAEAVAPKISKKKSAILAAMAPPEDAEFKSKMSIAMAKSWAKRKRAAKKGLR
jgi:hypothetical protein